MLGSTLRGKGANLWTAIVRVTTLLGSDTDAAWHPGDLLPGLRRADSTLTRWHVGGLRQGIRRRSFHLLLALSMAVLGACVRGAEAGDSGQSSGVTAITNARIIDGNGGEPLIDGVIVVRDGQIEAIGPSSSTSVPADAEVIDAAGRTIMPGLADMHVHLQGGWDGTTVDMLGLQRYLNALLYTGITTILSPGDVPTHILQIRQELDAGRLRGPTVYIAGAILDDAEPDWPEMSYAVSSVEQMTAYVRRLKAAGVDFIKGYRGLSDEMLSHLVTIAEAESLPVIVDLWDRNGSAQSAGTGITAFAHLGSDISAEAIEVMQQHGVAIITTIGLSDARYRWQQSGGDFAAEPLVGPLLPPWFLEPITDVVIHGRGTSYGAAGAERRPTILINAKRVFDAGIMLVAGTDTPAPGLFYGDGLHRELELLVEAGLTPLQAITAATKSAAALLGHNDWGTLEPGKRADILLVDGNPAQEILDTRKIEMIWQRGMLIDRSSLEFDAENDPGYRTAGSVNRAY